MLMKGAVRGKEMRKACSATKKRVVVTKRKNIEEYQPLFLSVASF